MKRWIAILLLAAVAFSLCACGAVKEKAELFYGSTLRLENKVFDKYDKIEWSSEDPSIAKVNDGLVSGMGPGETVITAKALDKVIATYTVTVQIKEITGIVFSTNSLEITEGDSASLSYSLFPDDASDYGLIWRSADSSVATVDDKGVIRAIAAGQTTITLSTEAGVVASAAVTVNLKPAYDRLSEKERAFTDALLSVVNKFKNPSSVKVLGIEEVADAIWYVNVSATNSYGGRNSKVYLLWSGNIYEADKTITSSADFDLDLINEALGEKIG